MTAANSHFLTRLAANDMACRARVEALLKTWDAWIRDLHKRHSAREWTLASSYLMSGKPLGHSQIESLANFFQLLQESSDPEAMKAVAVDMLEHGEWATTDSQSARPQDYSIVVSTFGGSFMYRILVELGFERHWQMDGAQALGTAVLMADYFGDPDSYERAGFTMAGDSRSIWKQAILMQQNLADSIRLATDLSRTRRRAFKLWWFHTLEMTRILESDAFSWTGKPIELSGLQRVQVSFQSRFGRVAFRR